MKKITAKTILILIILLSLSRAEAEDLFEYYKIENGKVYYNNGRDAYQQIEVADADSFVEIGFIKAKDKNNVYYKKNIIEGADPATFKIINNYYASDKNHVYFGDNAIENADLETFEVLSDRNSYAKDKNNAYCGGELIKNVEVDSFEVFYIYAKDKNYVYNCSHVVNEADANSFIELEDLYGKDSNNYFWSGKIITNLIEINRIKELEKNGFHYAEKTYHNNKLFNRLKGRIMLKIEEKGEAYYLNPTNYTIHYLGRPNDAFFIMQEQGIGITNRDLERIPIGLSELSGKDSDGDGLSDIFEDAIGTDKYQADTDGDGYNDYEEIKHGFDPLRGEELKLNYNLQFAEIQKGKIFLQVEKNGEAWYVSPVDAKRYFLGRPADAFDIMRSLSLGINNSDFENLIQD